MILRNEMRMNLEFDHVLIQLEVKSRRRAGGGAGVEPRVGSPQRQFDELSTRSQLLIEFHKHGAFQIDSTIKLNRRRHTMAVEGGGGEGMGRKRGEEFKYE